MLLPEAREAHSEIAALGAGIEIAKVNKELDGLVIVFLLLSRYISAKSSILKL